MFKTFKILFYINLVYLFLLIYLVFNEYVEFGIGLGGLFFVYISVLSVVIFGLVIIITLRLKNIKLKRALILIFTPLSILTSLFITYSFTFGRGYECPWNGEIINPRTPIEMAMDLKVDSIDKLIKLEPDNYINYLNKGLTYYSVMSYNYDNRMISSFKSALKYNDTCKIALESLRMIYYMNNITDSANMIEQQMLRINPSYYDKK